MLRESIFNISHEEQFRKVAIEIFQHQARQVPVYKEWLKFIRCNPEDVSRIEEIPFLPVTTFKTHKVLEETLAATVVFTSSGTTGQQQARHYIADETLYRESFNACFRRFYGDPKDFCILALLPSYLEREGSSLVYMADHLIRESGHPQSGFYLNQLKELFTVLEQLKAKQQPTILLGVTYALLDLAAAHPVEFPELIIIETGGMKGRRKELLRDEVHQVLEEAFGVPLVHSEYGMTELLSQAYSLGGGCFQCPPWMQIKIRDINDPFCFLEKGKTGGINIVDLANLHSVSFLATDDLGKLHDDGSFEVLGRFDQSDLRGCNLMIV